MFANNLIDLEENLSYHGDINIIKYFQNTSYHWLKNLLFYFRLIYYLNKKQPNEKKPKNPKTKPTTRKQNLVLLIWTYWWSQKEIYFSITILEAIHVTDKVIARMLQLALRQLLSQSS